MLTEDLTRATRLFRALSDETRLRILDTLRGGDRCVCDLAAVVGAQQPRLSFHLRVLREAGLVQDRREGRWIYYGLRPEALGEVDATIQGLRNEFVADVGDGPCCG
jgi:ArsR family transcriptional regulator, arsenate/arsenite/antimonite-responsive transcriptional repressor